MAEKRLRKISLIPTLNTLRKTLRKHISRAFGRISSPDSPLAMQSKSASMATDEKNSISTSSLKSNRSTRNFSALQHYIPPYCPDKTCQKESTNDGNSGSLQDRKVIRIRRFIPCLDPAEPQPRRRTTVGLARCSVISSSRIPTPTEPPKGGLYSHSVYQTEGKRSVISPVKRRSTITHQGEGSIKLNNKNETRPLATQTYPAAQRQILVFRKPAAQYTEGGNQKFARRMALAPTQGPLSMRKVRVGRGNTSKAQYLTLRHFQTQGQFPPTATTTIAESTNPMASPKLVKLIQGLEDLEKPHEALCIKLPTLKRSSKASPSMPAAQRQTIQIQRQTHEQARKSDAPTTYQADPRVQSSRYTDVGTITPTTVSDLSSKLPLAGTSSARCKPRGEKMGSAPLESMHPHNNPQSAHISNRFSGSRRSMSMERPGPRSQVETAMPSQYWLGRFMTLKNAFHYEDSFGEPDIATGFEMPSSHTRPFRGSHDDDDKLAAYRVKRAFMVLENFCATEEASESLREFRVGYVRRFGDRWMA